MRPRVGSFCTGYSGLELGLTMAGLDIDVLWHSEIDLDACAVLAAHYPDVPNLGDLKKLWKPVMGVEIAQSYRDLEQAIDVPLVDLICAGWPCQPFSAAGKRKGHLDERALWPYIAAAFRDLRPRFAFLENVPNIAGRLGELERATGDLAALGYDARWGMFRASQAGLPHRRERCFIFAAENAHGAALRQRWSADRGETEEGGAWTDTRGPALFPTPHANCGTGPGRQGRDSGMNIQTAIALLPTPTATDARASRNATSGRSAGKQFNSGTTLTDVCYSMNEADDDPAPDTNGAGLEGQRELHPAAREAQAAAQPGCDPRMGAGGVGSVDVG